MGKKRTEKTNSLNFEGINNKELELLEKISNSKALAEIKSNYDFTFELKKVKKVKKEEYYIVNNA